MCEGGGDMVLARDTDLIRKPYLDRIAERRNFGFSINDREIAHDGAYKKIERGTESCLELSTSS